LRITLIIQSVIAALVAAIAAWHGGTAGLWAALYGGATALVNSALLAWRMHRGRRRISSDPQRHLRSFMASSLERLAAIIVLLVAGFGPLGLAPGYLVAGFVAVQLGLVVAAVFNR